MGNFAQNFAANFFGETRPSKANTATGSFEAVMEGVTMDKSQPSLNDVADVTKTAKTNSKKTIDEYIADTMRRGTTDLATYANNKANNVASGLAQSNAVQVASLVAYKDLVRDGVDQINPTVNPVLIRNVAGRFDLPSMVTIAPTVVSFNAAGACYVGGEQIKADDYDPAILSKSFVLGGPKQGGVQWPIFGYDIAVRAFSTEVGDTQIDISCFDTTTVASEAGLDENAVQMYHHTYHLIDVNKQGKLVCALATGNSVINCGQVDTNLEAGHYLFFSHLSQELRLRDCFANLSIDAPTDTFVNSVLRVSGLNAILTITPLILCNESVARVLNNLDKDATGYVGALVNIRNNSQDQFNY